MTEQAKTAFWDAVRTVFLDRDGVINEKTPEGDYVHRAEDLKLLDGAAGAIARLNLRGVAGGAGLENADLTTKHGCPRSRL